MGKKKLKWQNWLKPEKVNGHWIHFQKNQVKYHKQRNREVIVYAGPNEFDDWGADFVGLFKSKEEAVKYLKENLAERT